MIIDRTNDLTALRQAIIDHTQGDLFWIGEILLAELEKETGFPGWVLPNTNAVGAGRKDDEEGSASPLMGAAQRAAKRVKTWSLAKQRFASRIVGLNALRASK